MQLDYDACSAVGAVNATCIALNAHELKIVLYLIGAQVIIARFMVALYGQLFTFM